MKRKPSKVEYGYVVEASLARSGCPNIKIYISDKPPVGLSDLQEAMFFNSDDPPDASGQNAYQKARSYAYWQLGYVVNAKRINGIITIL